MQVMKLSSRRHHLLGNINVFISATAPLEQACRVLSALPFNTAVNSRSGNAKCKHRYMQMLNLQLQSVQSKMQYQPITAISSDLFSHPRSPALGRDELLFRFYWLCWHDTRFTHKCPALPQHWGGIWADIQLLQKGMGFPSKFPCKCLPRLGLLKYFRRHQHLGDWIKPLISSGWPIDLYSQNTASLFINTNLEIQIDNVNLQIDMLMNWIPL